VPLDDPALVAGPLERERLGEACTEERAIGLLGTLLFNRL
jgi:hypothetical protein